MMILEKYNLKREEITPKELKEKIAGLETHRAYPMFIEFLNSLDDSKKLIYKHSGVERNGINGILVDPETNLTVYEIMM